MLLFMFVYVHQPTGFSAAREWKPLQMAPLYSIVREIYVLYQLQPLYYLACVYKGVVPWLAQREAPRYMPIPQTITDRFRRRNMPASAKLCQMRGVTWSLFRY